MARRVTILDPMRVAIIRLALLSLTDITVRRAITHNITPVTITPGLSQLTDTAARQATSLNITRIAIIRSGPVMAMELRSPARARFLRQPIGARPV